MRVIRSIRDFDVLPGGCALTIGNFDGLHRGHQAIVACLRKRATVLKVPAALMTFEPTPRAFFAPANPPARLSSLREKLVGAGGLGVDVFVRARFDAGFAAMSPEVFLEDLIHRRLGARSILVGEDFRFGHRRRGDIDTLTRFAAAHDIELCPLEEVRVGGVRVSSTAIRAALAAGEVPRAQQLLGHPYRISERVVLGEQVGRTLGFPTANLRLKRPAALRYGVYAVWVELADGRRVGGAASFGVRPTVDGKEPLLEIFLLDFAEDLYGQRIDVSFVAYVRDEERYDSLHALKTQMHQDVIDVRRLLAADQPDMDVSQE